MKHPDLILLGAALLGGSLFLATRSQLWPEAGLDLVVDAKVLEERAKVHDDAVAVIRRPDFLERLAKDGIEPVANTPEAFGAEIKADLARWGKIVKAAGAKLD